MNGITRRDALAGGLAGLALIHGAQGGQRVAPSRRVEALLAKMTLEEKAGQLTSYADNIRPDGVAFNPSVGGQDAAHMAGEIKAGRVGNLFGGTGVAGAKYAQDLAMQSRLKIPLIFASDVIHGFRTVFPIPLGEASCFDPALAEQVCRAVAVEATASGLHWTFAPMVDVARDERWGRVAEGAGEDPYLGAQYAAARVRGFQGPNLKAADSLLATAKHFVAYGDVSGGMDYNTVEVSEASLREIHLPPFKAAVDAGTLTLMSSFNDLNGIPMHENARLLTGVLRDEWKFRGVVISDYNADWELIPQGVAYDEADAAYKAFMAGVDISMQSGLYIRHLPGLVKAGKISMARFDQSVRRVLMLKEAIGLFDNPYRSIDAAAEKANTATPEILSLSREVGARSIVLLKNENGLLPLPKTGRRIALIGPFAQDRDHVHGTWAPWGDAKLNIDLATGIKAALADPSSLIVVKGCEIEAEIPGGFAQAAAAAQAADVVVLAVGESQDMSGEAHSRTTITVPAVQMRLAETVAAAGKPVVVLLRHGRAMALEGAVKDAQAILATWFLGTETGHAVADVLFGAVNPSGRLPVSFPYESGQEPYFYNHRTTGRPAPAGDQDQGFKARYISAKNEALYPFGYGLGYTTFALSNLTLSTDKLGWKQSLIVTADVENTGAAAGAHVAQLYMRDRVASRTRPIRELKGFQRVNLAPGEKQTVRFTLSRADLMFFGEKGWTVEPGWFDVWVASHSADGLKGSFELLAV